MDRKELKVGTCYWVMHTGQKCIVRLERIDVQESYGSRSRKTTRYVCTKMKTTRIVMFKSAQKFIRVAEYDELVRNGYRTEFVPDGLGKSEEIGG